MKILFLGIYTEKKIANEIQSNSSNFPFAQQKFEEILIEGFKQNNVPLDILSTLPILRWPHFKKVFINHKSKESNHIYLKFINLPIIKQFTIILSHFIELYKWNKKNKKEKKIVLIYGTNPINSLVPILFKKILNFKVTVIVSEINYYSYFDTSNLFKRLKKWIYLKILRTIENNYDGYILISKYMNEVINKNKKPSLIIEAICQQTSFNEISYFNRNKNIVYAGSLFKKYGISKLVEAFTRLNLDNFTLDIYGTGDYVDDIIEISKKNSKIRYFGTADNEIIKDIEKRAYLLVNPRPSNEAITRYSFPSKTIEYFSSRTACLITKLKGIPDEYFKYCYYFEDESIEGMANKIKQILQKDIKELEEISNNAFNYVNVYKNTQKQTKKIINFINEL